ncbi:hypothetical protein PAPYR_12347 [Paratrimastix pyriformis]|uniref:Uncharacterized protein n=1 Tax=Paratrimastix pyriformis TaxID=342808 RepID=A0ABQ8U4A0_9EUKA|nr:hypothetical protein PAPYR_12347 [Paratrimastix pyriformis]
MIVFDMIVFNLVQIFNFSIAAVPPVRRSAPVLTEHQLPTWLREVVGPSRSLSSRHTPKNWLYVQYIGSSTIYRQFTGKYTGSFTYCMGSFSASLFSVNAGMNFQFIGSFTGHTKKFTVVVLRLPGVEVMGAPVDYVTPAYYFAIVYYRACLSGIVAGQTGMVPMPASACAGWRQLWMMSGDSNGRVLRQGLPKYYSLTGYLFSEIDDLVRTGGGARAGQGVNGQTRTP